MEPKTIIPHEIKELTVHYLVFFPFTKSTASLEQFSLRSPKGAPYFFEHDIDVRSFPGGNMTIDDIPVEVKIQIFDSQVWVYEYIYTLPYEARKDIIGRNHTLQETMKKHLVDSLKLHAKTIIEEYTIAHVIEPEVKPDVVIDSHARTLAGFIRAFYEKSMDRREVDDILMTRVRYSDQDLVVVDWNGAILVTQDGDDESDIDLLKIGNYQLVRYRMLDEMLEKKLNHLRNVVERSAIGKFRRNVLLQEIVSTRLSIILTLEKLDNSLLLIGDWYSSQLYRAIVTEFYIDVWKKMVISKLDNLRSLHETISENFILSWRRIIDQATFIGWFVMMIGYLIILYFDFMKK